MTKDAKGKMGKGGFSAVEMIVSFTLFVGMMMMLLIYMNPLKSHAVLSNVDYISDKVSDNSIVKLEVVSVTLTSTVPTCFTVPNPFAGAFVNQFVLGKKGNAIDSQISGNQISIGGTDKIYYIYSGNVAITPSTVGSCVSIPVSNYTFGIIRTESLYSYDLLSSMNKSYFNNYVGLKNKFVSPYDFAVYVYDENTTYFNMKKTLPVTSIVTQEYPIQLLKGGQKIKATMRVYAW